MMTKNDFGRGFFLFCFFFLFLLPLAHSVGGRLVKSELVTVQHLGALF